MTHLADKICTVASENENLSEKDIPHYRAQIQGMATKGRETEEKIQFQRIQRSPRVYPRYIRVN